MSKHNQLRHQIALEAGKILAKQGHLSFDQARHKAAERIGVNQRGLMPNNEEIELALRDYQALFLSDRQPEALKRLRQQAKNAMGLLDSFQPRLTGSVLSGTADQYTPVTLHLHTDAPEEIIFTLLDHQIPYQESDALLHYPNGSSETHPQLSFQADDTTIDLVVLPLAALRNPPLNPINRRPDKGASLQQLAELIEPTN